MTGGRDDCDQLIGPAQVAGTEQIDELQEAGFDERGDEEIGVVPERGDEEAGPEAPSVVRARKKNDSEVDQGLESVE